MTPHESFIDTFYVGERTGTTLCGECVPSTDFFLPCKLGEGESYVCEACGRSYRRPTMEEKTKACLSRARNNCG